MAEVHYMTQEGLDKLKKDLADALAQRPVIAAAIGEAREKGDLSENAEYDAAREAQETEADFSHGKLAATTPIGRALIGHCKGDVVEAKVPSGVLKFKILDISL